MSTIVRVPASLSQWFGDQDEVNCRGKTVNECFEKLVEMFPGIRDRLFKENELSPAILVFLNGENIRFLKGLATEVGDGDEIGIIPLAAGG